MRLIACTNMSSTSRHELLAQERQRLWRLMSVYDTAHEHRADRVLTITTELNGHAQELDGGSPRAGNYGLWGDRRATQAKR